MNWQNIILILEQRLHDRGTGWIRSKPSINDIYQRMQTMSAPEKQGNRITQQGNVNPGLYGKRWFEAQQILNEEQQLLFPYKNFHKSQNHGIDLHQNCLSSLSFSFNDTSSPRSAEPPVHESSDFYNSERLFQSSPISNGFSTTQTNQRKKHASPDRLLAQGVSLDVKDEDTVSFIEDIKPLESTLRAEEIEGMLSIMKSILHQSFTGDAHKSNTLKFLDQSKSGPTTNALSYPQKSSDILLSELNLDKISQDDEQFAERLDTIREKLGTLVASVPSKIPPTYENSEDYKRTKPMLKPLLSPVLRTACFTIGFFVLTMVLFGMVRYRAEYLYEYTYHDTIYPELYPIPAYVRAFLSSRKSYGTPFTAPSLYF